MQQWRVNQEAGDWAVAFVDKALRCKDCGTEFVFTAGEQEFYAGKGFENEPTRCKDCRGARKRDRDGGGFSRPFSGDREARQLHKVVCASCGIETEVPFRPKNDRPVYCRDCFSAQRRQAF